MAIAERVAPKFIEKETSRRILDEKFRLNKKYRSYRYKIIRLHCTRFGVSSMKNVPIVHHRLCMYTLLALFQRATMIFQSGDILRNCWCCQS